MTSLSGEELFKKGLEAFEKKDYKNDHKYYYQARKLNHYKSIHYLATMYRDGLGVEVDKIKATRYYKIAAKGGNASSYIRLANRYLKGDGIDKDYKKAYKCFKKASDLGIKEGNEGIQSLKKLGFNPVNSIGPSKKIIETIKNLRKQNNSNSKLDIKNLIKDQLNSIKKRIQNNLKNKIPKRPPPRKKIQGKPPSSARRTQKLPKYPKNQIIIPNMNMDGIITKDDELFLDQLADLFEQDSYYNNNFSDLIEDIPSLMSQTVETFQYEYTNYLNYMVDNGYYNSKGEIEYDPNQSYDNSFYEDPSLQPIYDGNDNYDYGGGGNYDYGGGGNYDYGGGGNYDYGGGGNYDYGGGGNYDYGGGGGFDYGGGCE